MEANWHLVRQQSAFLISTESFWNQTKTYFQLRSPSQNTYTRRSDVNFFFNLDTKFQPDIW